MKAFVLDHILDLIAGFCLSSTTHPAWPGLYFKQDRRSKIETDLNLISCRENNDRQS
ncbi:MAG: hypothetical protein H6R17_3399 [Proteobacteria bacterium]|nr:hypothetical protein [Pseudomonadota bacterium]